MSTDIRDSNLVKGLAANDKKTRDAALTTLLTYLSSTRSLTSLDYLKIHTGLFYCMWMCDRPLPQQSLATSLATLVSSLPTEKQAPFYQGFWEIMRKEWERIDLLRMEKFLLLARRYLAVGFEIIVTSSTPKMKKKEEKKPSKKSSQKSDTKSPSPTISPVGKSLLEILSDIPCGTGPDTQRTPNGMRFHVIDIWVDELERLGVLAAAKESEEGAQRLESLLQPLRKLGKESINKAVRNKVKEALEDERLPENEKVEGEGVGVGEGEGEGEGEEDEETSDGEEDGWGGIED